MTTLIQAKVKYPSKVMETRFGKRINVVLISDSGEEIKQWSNPDDPELTALKKNQQVTLIKNGDKYSIVSSDTNQQPAVPEQLTNGLWIDEEKKHLSTQASQLITFYDYCQKQVRQKIPDFTDPESIRSIATTIFLQSIRR